MKKHFMKVFAILAVAAILILGIVAGRYWEAQKNHKEELSSSAVTAQISELSELSTAELLYRGLVKYSEGEITFLTKKEFTMIYSAQVKAGVDLSKASVQVQGNHVTISLPTASIQSISIDPDSLEFYDEKYALFNFQDRTDTVTALQYAKEDINARALETDLLSSAEEKAKSLITNLLSSLWRAQNQEQTLNIQFEILAEE